MWARIVEFTIACWLALTPFIFRIPSNECFYWMSNFVCAILIALFSLLCFHRHLRKMHLFNLIVGFWLIGLAFTVKEVPIAPHLQNGILVGVILLMLGIIPSESELPSPHWREFDSKSKRQ